MKTFVRSLCFAIVMLSALTALAQNPNYSSYYSYTVTYNEDGSAAVTPTAEVFGWDDADDWVIGGYRPLCSLHPKAQVTSDADWVSTIGRGLYQTIDYVHTGAPVQLPADGTEISINYAVEVDVSCNRPSYYYLYPSLTWLSLWSPIRMEWFFLQGFSPFQANPPSWVTYCTSPDVCPVGNGQAYFYNFADYADFFTIRISIRNTSYGPPPTVLNETCYYTMLACAYGQPTCTPATPGITFVPSCPDYMLGQYLVVNGKCYFGVGKAASGPGPCD